MAKKYEPELRDKVLRLHLEEGRSNDIDMLYYN
jgi:hypothetical protein